MDCRIFTPLKLIINDFVDYSNLRVLQNGDDEVEKETATRIIKLRDLVISTKLDDSRASSVSMEPLDLRLEEEFKDMKSCQNFCETGDVFPLLQSLRLMKKNVALNSEDEKCVKSHDNETLVTAFVAAVQGGHYALKSAILRPFFGFLRRPPVRVSEENNEIPIMSEEFANLSKFGEAIVTEILQKRKIGETGKYGYQQVKYRSIFVTQADKDKFEGEKHRLSYAGLRRNLETELSNMPSQEAAAAIRLTVAQIEVGPLTVPQRTELLYKRGGGLRAFLINFFFNYYQTLPTPSPHAIMLSNFCETSTPATETVSDPTPMDTEMDIYNMD